MKIIDFLKNNKGRQYCDDCLSEDLKIRPRQQEIRYAVNYLRVDISLGMRVHVPSVQKLINL